MSPTLGQAAPTGLKIGGIQAFSSVDWPGKLVATVFCQGCPWDCPYCHNPSLRPSQSPELVDEAQLWGLLEARRGLLDAVVFSGGEACRQRELLAAARRVRELGFEVGLHTCGAYPRRLAALLEAQLVDWVGLDYKALPGEFAWILPGRERAEAQRSQRWKGEEQRESQWEAGLAGGGKAQVAQEKVEECLALLAGQERVAWEVRATVVPGATPLDLTPEKAVDLGRYLRGRGVESFALQAARTPESQREAQWQARCSAAAKSLEGLGFREFFYRS